jgi:hypothetical protein
MYPGLNHRDPNECDEDESAWDSLTDPSHRGQPETRTCPAPELPSNDAC